MSVCSQCVKTSADSKEKYEKTIFLNISESYIEYNIFDTDMSIVESNEITKEIDISSNLALLQLT